MFDRAMEAPACTPGKLSSLVTVDAPTSSSMTGASGALTPTSQPGSSAAAKPSNAASPTNARQVLPSTIPKPLVEESVDVPRDGSPEFTSLGYGGYWRRRLPKCA